MEHTLTIDIGTTSCKVICFNEKDETIARQTVGYKTEHPKIAYSEQDPDAIYRAILKALVNLDLNIIVDHIVLSSAMHSLMAVDQDDEPLTPLMIWADNRASDVIDWFKTQPECDTFYRKTGTPIHPMSPFAKLLWLKETTDLLTTAPKFIGIKAYVWYKLTGQMQVDYSIASATGLFNSQTLEWDQTILNYLGLSVEQLPEAVPVDYCTPIQSKDLFSQSFINKQTKLVIGASDGVLANLSSVKSESHVANMTVGTSGAIRLTTTHRMLDPLGRTFCYYLQPNQWVIGGAVNNGGNVLNWLDQLLYEHPGRLYRELAAINFNVQDFDNPLVFLPHINGERAPFWDTHLTGEFIGLSAFHKKKDLIKAAIEGIFFNLYDVFCLLEEVSGQIESVTVSGGLFRNEELIRVAANVFNIPFYVNDTIEQSSRGAALLIGTLKQVKQKDLSCYQPDGTMRDYYKRKYQHYKQALST